MVRKSAVIFGILAVLALGAGMSWGYTVSLWPAPGVSNVAWGGGSPCLLGPEFTLRGPVAPSCEPAIVPGILHGAMSIPFRAIGAVAMPLMTGQLALPGAGCCDVELGDPAYVMAAVPCTAVQRFVPPCGGF
jgi:hypothetical protein